MNQNTVFMLLTTLLRNFYTKYISEVSRGSGHLISRKARLKKFIYHFITCPARWVKDKNRRYLTTIRSDTFATEICRTNVYEWIGWVLIIK